MESMTIEQALEEIRKGETRKFVQTVDLIINLKKFDVKKNSINIFVPLPNKIKEKRICGFIEMKSNLIDTIPKAAFPKYKEKKELKNLVKKYDFFISSGPNMPAVATTFGRVLGPAGKMPSPKLGIVLNENDKEIGDLIAKINAVIRIQTKEPVIKIMIGKEKMSNENIAENIRAVYNAVLNELPNKNDQIKSVMIKLTMGKPVRVMI
jgi:large subunit ribosomal protein L1